MAKKGLGKGLGAIFGEDVIKESEEDIAKAKAAAADKGEEMTSERMVKLALIEPNKDQPRKDFNEEQLRELADSIKRYGVLQPLLVQKKGNFYEIIAGERRWRAAKMAGLKEIPVVLREYTKQEVEFRAVGSSANCAAAMLVLNAAVADQLRQFKAEVDAKIATGKDKFAAIIEVIRKDIKECKAIHFDGNGYSEEWKAEAARRGLDCETSVPLIFDAYLKDSRQTV